MFRRQIRLSVRLNLVVAVVVDTFAEQRTKAEGPRS